MAKYILKTYHIVILIGFFIVLSSIVIGLVFYTKTYSLSKNIISLSEPKLLPENEGKIVYLSGVIDTTSGTIDNALLINRKALKLYREVEILGEDNNEQLIWTPGHGNYTHESSNGTYKKNLNLNSKIFHAQNTFIGGFSLDSYYIATNLKEFTNVNINEINKARKILLNKSSVNKAVSYNCMCNLEFCGGGAVDGIKGELHENISSIDTTNLYSSNNSGWVCTTNNHLALDKEDDLLLRMSDRYQVQDNYLYFGKNYENPQKEDIRISYSELPPQTYTILGIQTGSSITPISIDGQKILLVMQDEYTLKQMLKILATKKHDKLGITSLLGIMLLICGVTTLILQRFLKPKML